jgi:ubiquinone/menaquinone biosynthesis C-methylase UbiE
MHDEVRLQREYYAGSASLYDDRHATDYDEHFQALGWLAALIRSHKFVSLLDVGSGTGRCLAFLKKEALPIALIGVEPVEALREIGRRKGLSNTELVEGDALALPFGDRTVDVVCAFGVLHHIRDHRRAVSEMCRVARRAVFISDSNNFGQGGALSRAVKQAVRAAGLWSAADFVRTRGKRYHYSEEDGVYYSYSVMNDIPALRRRFSELRFMGTRPSGANLYRTASHIAVFAQDLGCTAAAADQADENWASTPSGGDRMSSRRPSNSDAVASA